MKTYQAFKNTPAQSVGAFIQAAVLEHIASHKYRIAADAEEYYAGRNPTTAKFQRLLRTAEGTTYPDLYSSNYKTKSGFFRKLVFQQSQYVLGNGMTFSTDEAKQKLGADIDVQAATAAKIAMVDSVSFLFFNLDHVEVFGLVDTPTRPGFVPLFDEFSGELMAGIRYWYSYTSASVRKLNAVLYTEDGYTAYRETGGGLEQQEETKPYIITETSTAAHGVETMSGRGYGTLPIVPMYANDTHQSELVFVREAIDCYDFEKNGLANDIDDNSHLFWILKNSGGMDDMDIAQFLDRMRTVHAAAVDNADDVTPHEVNVPVEARRTILEILEKDIYRDAMLFNAQDLSAGNKTATEINAAYQAQDDKCADFENHISTAISTLYYKIFGVWEIPKFKWQKIANQTEMTNMVMTALPVIGTRLALEKLPWVTPEEVQQRLDEMDEEDMTRLLGYGGQPDGGAA